MKNYTDDLGSALVDRHEPDPLERKTLRWLFSSDTGLSSVAMAQAICEIDPEEDYRARNVPIDADDFGRCVRYLEAVPEARPLMHRAAAMSDAWFRLVECWQELEHMYRTESYRKTSDRIQELIGWGKN